MNFQIVSLNSRGFSKRFQKYLIDNLHASYDVFCFQETFITDPELFCAFSKARRGLFLWSPAVGKRAGVLTCFSDSFSGVIRNWRRDVSGRVISLAFELDGLKINLINIYAPINPTERKVFFDNLHEYFLPSDAVIIAGDYNCYDHHLDKFGVNFVAAKYLSVFRSTFSLSDAWRKFHPRLRQCTWLILIFLSVLGLISLLFLRDLCLRLLPSKLNLALFPIMILSIFLSSLLGIIPVVLVVGNSTTRSGDLSVSSEISELESELKALTLKELGGSKVRSRVQWLEEGERPTRYFFKLERERFERNILTSILDSNDVEVFTRKEIERAHVHPRRPGGS